MNIDFDNPNIWMFMPPENISWIIWIIWTSVGTYIGSKRILIERDLVISDIICLLCICGMIGWPFKKIIFHLHSVAIKSKTI